MTCKLCDDSGYVEEMFDDRLIKARCPCNHKIDNEVDDDSDDVVHFDENSISFKHE